MSLSSQICTFIISGGLWSLNFHLNFYSLEKAHKVCLLLQPWELRIPLCTFLCFPVSSNWLLPESHEKMVQWWLPVTASVWNMDESPGMGSKCWSQAPSCWPPTLCRAKALSLLPITSPQALHTEYSLASTPCVCPSHTWTYVCLGRAARISVAINQWIPLPCHKSYIKRMELQIISLTTLSKQHQIAKNVEIHDKHSQKYSN